MPGKKHMKGAPPSVNRYYEECMASDTAKSKPNPKEYCARVAWTRYCSYKNPDYPGCTEKGKAWAKESAAFEHTVIAEMRKMAGIVETWAPDIADIQHERETLIRACQAAGIPTMGVPENYTSAYPKLTFACRRTSIGEVIRVIGDSLQRYKIRYRAGDDFKPSQMASEDYVLTLRPMGGLIMIDVARKKDADAEGAEVEN